MCVPLARMSQQRSAQALQSVLSMPRKQRFKPSRKPQSTQAPASNQQVDDRKDINPDQEIGQQAPANDEAPTANEREQG